jgi:hypothetical protein
MIKDHIFNLSTTKYNNDESFEFNLERCQKFIAQ